MGNMVMAYTDGSCRGNPGPGGWAAILNFPEEVVTISGHSIGTTNNRMELLAVVMAVKELRKRKIRKIIINSDSAYVVNGMNKGWAETWKRQGWTKKSGDEVANSDLWECLLKMCNKKTMSVMFNKIAAHKGHTFNEMADEQAKAESEIASQIVSKVGAKHAISREVL